MTDLEKAIQILNEENCSFVLVNGDKEIKSFEKGLAPLIDLYESGEDFFDYSAADKICGRAASFLYVMLGVKEVYAKIMSKLSIQILDRAQIEYKTDFFVESILDENMQNLEKLEEVVLRSGTPKNAYNDLKNFYKETK